MVTERGGVKGFLVEEIQHLEQLMDELERHPEGRDGVIGALRSRLGYDLTALGVLQGRDRYLAEEQTG